MQQCLSKAPKETESELPNQKRKEDALKTKTNVKAGGGTGGIGKLQEVRVRQRPRH